MNSIWIDPSHPFWPHFRAVGLALGRGPGIYPLPFQDWLLWRYHFQLKGVGFVPLSADDAAHVLDPLQEAA